MERSICISKSKTEADKCSGAYIVSVNEEIHLHTHSAAVAMEKAYALLDQYDAMGCYAVSITIDMRG